MNTKKYTKDNFIEISKGLHGDFYNYDKTLFAGYKELLVITCPIHGDFEQRANRHLLGSGCKACGKEKSRKNRLKTTEEFIEDAKKVHGDKYDYSLVEYINTKNKIKICCENHGSFFQTPTHHLTGTGCPKCSKENNKKQTKSIKIFKEDADKVHNNFYNYDKSVYIKSSIKLEITCPTHGDFLQTPASHLQGSGCPKCGEIKRYKNSTKTQEQFIEKAKEIHGDKYDYSKSIYINNRTKVIIGCTSHGEFSQAASSHLYGNGCPKCATEQNWACKIKPQEQYIEESSKLHNNRYTYEKTIYEGSKKKIIITCPIHGDFTQLPHAHSKGAGCKRCANKNILSWTRSNYIKQANGKVCTFYVLRCFNREEEFYKIGITMNTIEKRYISVTRMPYEYEVISEVKGSAGFIWDLELEEKRKLKSLHYIPKMEFHGSKTECFTDYKL